MKPDPTRLYPVFANIFQYLGTSLLQLSDDKIGHLIFEEFDIDMISFLHDDSLQSLLSAGYIDSEIGEKAQRIRAIGIQLEANALWNMNAFRTAKEWREILTLGDEIKLLLANRWRSV